MNENLDENALKNANENVSRKFNSIPEILSDIKKGKIVIILDDQDRENEGDFVMASDRVTSEAINFMGLYGRGLICVPIDVKTAKRLELTPMTQENSATYQTAFTVTVDAKENITTGISANDRATTIQLMMNKNSKPNDFVKPGHIFPLIAKEGGVSVRRGHTEAAVDLARLAGCSPSGVICEILKEDGSLARGAEIFEVAKRFDLKVGTIADLVQYIEINKQDADVVRISTTKFPNKYGVDFQVSVYQEFSTQDELMAITLGDHFNTMDSTLVRMHSECLTGDVFGSLRCDCGEQLDLAMKEIVKRGSGILLYLKQEGRGIGLSEKIKSYELQEMGFDTVEANIRLGHPIDLRSYEFAAKVLQQFKLKKIELMSNNPEKIESLVRHGLNVSRFPLISKSSSFNQFYLQTKKEKLGHLI